MSRDSNELPSDSIPARAWKTLVILSLLATMVMYAETMLVPAIPDLIKDFNISYSTSSWILTTYLVAGAIMTPITGKLSDIYGKKRMLLIIMIIYAVGVSLGGFSTNIYEMLTIRVIQGIGMSMFPIAFGLIREQFPIRKLAIGQGVISSMFAAGAVIGLIAGGHLIQNFGWQATFFSIIPVVIVLIAIVQKFINVGEVHPQWRDDSGVPGTPKKLRLDVQGAVTLAVSVIAFLMALTFVETGDSIGSTTMLGLVGVGIVYLVLFVLIERRSSTPLVDLKVLMNKTILPSNILIMVVGMSMFMVFQTIPVLIRSPSPLGFGEDPVATANVQLPFAIVLLIFGPTSGFIISKMGSTKPIIAGSIIGAVGFAALLVYHSTEFMISANLAVLSTGLSLINVGAMNIIMIATPKQNVGVSMGMSTLIRIIGASVGPAMAGMFMQTHRTTLPGVAGSFPTQDSYNLIFLCATMVALASIGLAVFLRTTVSKTLVHAK
ncbi:MAG: MFS transporter [Thaumarchaeota archaeon]|nr:MFS transporter [Nitrososphaerota archaeon]